jgi:outer membrane biogenesis lipoprotein LolB
MDFSGLVIVLNAKSLLRGCYCCAQKLAKSVRNGTDENWQQLQRRVDKRSQHILPGAASRRLTPPLRPQVHNARKFD